MKRWLLILACSLLALSASAQDDILARLKAANTYETLETSFAKMPGGIWCRENCWRFGFILRYGEEWEEITGYKYEPWHFRYVGKEFSKEITEANIPFETWMINYRVKVLKELLGDKTEPAQNWVVQEENTRD